MAGTKKGAQKLRETLLKKYGGEAGLSAEMARRTSLRKKVGPGGFSNKELAKEAGRKGGSKGKGHLFAHGKVDPKDARDGKKSHETNPTEEKSQAGSQELPEKEDLFTD